MSVAKIGGDRVDHWSIVDRYSYDLPWWKDVVISDNILKASSPAEVEAVFGGSIDAYRSDE